VLWLFAALTAVAVIVIALLAVGRVTFTLAEQPRASSYDLEEAVLFVADQLPDDATAQLSYDDVRTVLGLHLDYLEAKGVAHEGPAEPAAPVEPEPDLAEETTAEPAAPLEFPEWPEAARAGPLVADDDEALPYILGRLAETSADIEDVHVVQVLEAERSYLEAIGAIGPAVPPPDPSVGE
jgi:hypothetical protein